MSEIRRRALLCLGLGVITFGLFYQCKFDAFLDYDDQQYVTENPHVQAGLTRKGISWAFRSYYASNWHPVTWLSHMLDWQIYSLNPAGHHLTNVLLHTATTVLLFLVLRQMTGAVWRSAVVAALFGWHPLHVESVAWVAERKDVLSAFFFVCAIGAYATYVQRRLNKLNGLNKNEKTDPGGAGEAGSRSTLHPALFYALSLLLFACGLMSKSMVVTLPFVLLLLDYWPLQRFDTSIRRLVFEKVPFFILSIAVCALTLAAQRQGLAIVSRAGLPVSERISHAFVAYVHYLGATFVPRRLAVFYPYEAAAFGFRAIAAVSLVAAVTLCAVRTARSLPYLVVGWFWYLGMLVPVIGLIQVGDQAWADRYTYLPLIGIFVVLTWGAVEAFRNSPIPGLRSRFVRPATIVIVLLPIAGMTVMTVRHLQYWRNTRTLFTRAAQVTQRNARALTVLGSLLARDGKLEEAKRLYTEALGYKPFDPQAHFFMGKALEEEGKPDAAILEYQQTLWFKPLREKARLELGMVLAKEGKYDAAAEQYREVLAINPESAIAENNFAKLLHVEGRLDEAMQHYAAALRLDNTLAQAHNNFGVLLLQNGRVDEGIAQLREAVRLRPNDPESNYNLALGLNQQKNWTEAAEIFSRLAPQRPSDAKLAYEFGLALAHLHKTREAMSRYAHALLLQPDFPEALNGLSWILATDPHPEFRNGAEAVRMAERACELTGYKQASLILTLAAAYAEAGRFSDAVTTVEKARSLRTREDDPRYLGLLESFQKAQPWRQEIEF